MWLNLEMFMFKEYTLLILFPFSLFFIFLKGFPVDSRMQFM